MFAEVVFVYFSLLVRSVPKELYIKKPNDLRSNQAITDSGLASSISQIVSVYSDFHSQLCPSPPQITNVVDELLEDDAEMMRRRLRQRRKRWARLIPTVKSVLGQYQLSIYNCGDHSSPSSVTIVLFWGVL